MQTKKAVINTLNDEYRSTFEEMGFVKLKGLLSQEEVSILRAAMGLALETFNQSPNSYNVTAAADSFWKEEAANDDQGSSQHDLATLGTAVRNSRLPRLIDEPTDGVPRGNFLLDTGIWRRAPQLATFALFGKLPSLTADLLGASRIRYYDDQMFIKEAGAIDRVAFHQDVPYFHLDGASGCVFWIPLDSVKAGGGRIGYIPGSHRWKQTFKPNIFVSEMPFPGAEGIDMPRIEADPESYNVQYVDAEPGDVLVHHFLTVHGSEGNSRGARRRAFSLRYCDAELRYRHRVGAPAQPLHKQDVKDGDVLDDRFHPLVWPPANDNDGHLAALARRRVA